MSLEDLIQHSWKSLTDSIGLEKPWWFYQTRNGNCGKVLQDEDLKARNRKKNKIVKITATEQEKSENQN
ncbi:10507_t:CDS:2 [Gigaspora rosea]|nr:10507_t:CDS:2 [Gigaspora rosea]